MEEYVNKFLEILRYVDYIKEAKVKSKIFVLECHNIIEIE